MSAFTRTHSDGVWLAGYDPARADFEDFDRKVVAGVNGEDGGAYAPSSPIRFQNTVSGAATILTGPLKVCYGARLTTGSGGRFVISGASFEQLAPGHAGASRALLTPMAGAMCTVPDLAVLDPLRNALRIAGARANLEQSTVDVGAGYVWTYQPPVLKTALTTRSFRTHDGGTLTAVTLTYAQALGIPRARVVQCTAGGGVIPITTIAAGAADGWVTLPAADPYQAVQTATLAVDAGTVVDKSRFFYAFQIEEQPTSATDAIPFLKRVVRAASPTNLVTMRDTPILDGVQTAAGDIILLTAQANAAENGLWIVYGAGTAFYPVGVTSVSGSFVASTSLGLLPAGFVVRVSEGQTLGGTFWRMKNRTDVVGPLLTLGGSGNPALVVPQGFEMLATAGNTYFSLRANHVGITDTRWQ